MNDSKKNIVATGAKGCLLASALLLSPIASADTLFGIYAGASLWQADVEGTIGQSDNGFDFTGDFNDGESDNLSVYVAVEHFIPILPNLLVRTTPVEWTGSADSATGILGGLITFEEEVDAELNVDMLDATLY